MKRYKKYIVTLLLIFSVFFAESTKMEVITSNPNEIVLAVKNEVPVIKEALTEKGTFIRLRDEFSLDGVSTEIGKAELPVQRVFVEIPQGAEVVSVKFKIQNSKFKILPFSIYPLQPPIPKTGPKPEFAYDEEFYQSDKFWPENLVDVSLPFQLRQARLVLLEIFPCRYLPKENLLEIVTEAEIRIELSGSDLMRTQEMYERYANEVNERYVSILINRTAKLSNVSIGYYIICPDAWVMTMQPLTNFLKEMGYKVFLAKLSEIGYTKEQIRNYLIDRYNNAAIPPTYILLVGDTDSISGWIGGGASSPYTDLPYSYYTASSYLPQTDVGRWSVRNVFQLDSLVKKTITYLKGENTGLWSKKALFVASDDANWHALPESTHVYSMRKARAKGMICDSIFLFYGDALMPAVNKINEGLSWFVYSGHGSDNAFLDFSPQFTREVVRSLTNVNKIPLVLSYACNTGKYENDECLMETWLRNGFRGAIAAVGSTIETSWIRDDYFQRFLFDAVCDSNFTWIGGMLNKAKLRAFQYHGDGPTTRAYCEAYNILGLPSANIYTDTLLILNPNYPSSVPVGPNTITVQTGTTRKCLIGLLSKRDTIHQAQFTFTGSAQFSFSSQPCDTFIVTISGHNIQTHQGLILVSSPDVGVTKLIVPVQVDSGQVMTPACSVYNYGNVSTSYWVRMRIGDFYETTVQVENHLPGTRRYLTFSACTLRMRGFNLVSCSTELTGDINPTNDRKIDSVFVRVLEEGQDCWTQLKPIPTLIPTKYVKNGGAITATTAGELFAFRGRAKEFYKYTPETDSWVLMESIPFGYTTTKTPGKGAALCWDGANTIYATKGNGTYEFWAYHIPTNTWTRKAYVPAHKPLKGGTSLVFKDGKVYLLAGRQISDAPTNFFEFTPDADTGTWTPKPTAPLAPDNKVYKDGSCLTILGNTIYALKGGGRHNYFYKFDGTNWTELAPIPLFHPQAGTKKIKVKDGGAMTSDSCGIYAIKGGGSQQFWRYTPGDPGIWTALLDIPRLHKKSVPKTGAALAYTDGRVYLLKGNNTPEFWQYGPITALASTEITPLTNTAVMIQTSNLTVNPNPFNNTIRYTVQISGKVTIKLYNATGRLIETITNEYHHVGSYTKTLSAKNLAKGIYFLKYEDLKHKNTKKFVLL